MTYPRLRRVERVIARIEYEGETVYVGEHQERFVEISWRRQAVTYWPPLPTVEGGATLTLTRDREPRA